MAIMTWPLTSDGAGAVTFTANDWRTLINNLFTEGILGADSYEVRERQAGANMSVDIRAGVAVIQGDDTANQGRYLAREDTEQAEAVTLADADPDDDRIDLVGLQLRDPSAGGASGRDTIYTSVTGTPAASPSAPATPASFLTLATVLVQAGTTSVQDADITDQRNAVQFEHTLADVSTSDLIDGAVTTVKLANSAVTTAKINNGAVTTTKLADDAVTNAKIATGAVNADSIADGTVGTAELGTDSVTNDKIATGAVNADSIQDGTVGTAELGTDSVTTVKITNSAVTTAKIANGNVTTGKIADDAVTSAKIATGAVGSSQIADGSVGTAELADDAVTAAKVDASMTRLSNGSTEVDYVKIGDTVFVRGRIISGDDVTMPAGFRTGSLIYFPGLSGLGNVELVEFQTDGTVTTTQNEVTNFSGCYSTTLGP